MFAKKKLQNKICKKNYLKEWAEGTHELRHVPSLKQRGLLKKGKKNFFNISIFQTKKQKK